MSQSTQQTVACPHCGASSIATLWQSVNVTLDPELKDRLFSRELLEYTCPDCGETTHLFYPLLYHDPDKQVLIWMLPPDERGEVSLDRLTKGATQASLLPGYRLRLVASLNELLEKVMIFDYGLDDRAVELMKELLWQDGVCDSACPRHLFFLSQVVTSPQGERQIELVQLQPPGEPYVFRVGWESGYQVVQDIMYREYGVAPTEAAEWRKVDHAYAKELLGS